VSNLEFTFFTKYLFYLPPNRNESFGFLCGNTINSKDYHYSKKKEDTMFQKVYFKILKAQSLQSFLQEKKIKRKKERKGVRSEMSSKLRTGSRYQEESC
ncbi:hypothetical protein CEXT_809001, partial [Caerostris extrusa]